MGDETVLNPNGTPIPLAMPQPVTAPTPVVGQAPVATAAPSPTLQGLGTTATPQSKTYSQRFFDAFNSGVQSNATYSVDPTTGQITKNPGNSSDWSRTILAAGLQALGDAGNAQSMAQQQIANTKFSGGINGRAFGAAAFNNAQQQQQQLKAAQQQQANQNAFNQAKEQSENVRQSQDLKLRQAADARAQADNMINAIKGYNTNLGDGYVPVKLGGTDVPEFENAEDAFRFMNQNGDALHKDYKWRLAFDPATKQYQVMERAPNFDDRLDRAVQFIDGSSERIHGATQDEANAYMKQRNAVIQQKEPLYAVENDPNQAFSKENYAVTMAYLDKRLKDAPDDDAKARIQKLTDMGNDIKAERVKETHATELANLTVAKAQSIVSAPKGTYADEDTKQAQDFLDADVAERGKVKEAEDQAHAASPAGQLEQQAKQQEIALNKQKLELGSTKPVYAYNNQTKQLEQTTQATVGANPQLYSNPVEVKETDLRKDQDLARQLGDAQLNLSRYRAASQRVPDNDSTDRSRIASLIGDDKLKAAFMGAELPTDWLNKLYSSDQWQHLSPEAQDAVIGYIGARGAIIAYQKAVSGSGRSTQEQLNLELQNIPNPLLPKNIREDQFNRFQQNIDQAGAGMPKLVGIDRPQEIRTRVEAQEVQQHPPAPPVQRPPTNGTLNVVIP